ncbi:hypothetical protein RRG08_039643 [Elysia crispata]|uniref:Uncharacterized protein n=1 Tax=Elysia crispata TaxID=231223 RepID=A0AAE1CVP5_9GAST|nr:hypothetical protein RRG08_039643 [Elysia crispata]
MAAACGGHVRSAEEPDITSKTCNSSGQLVHYLGWVNSCEKVYHPYVNRFWSPRVKDLRKQPDLAGGRRSEHDVQF